jgi:moderate conductance mechanosensitive channel
MDLAETLDAFGRTLAHPIFRISFIILLAIILQLLVRSAIDRVVRRAVRRHRYATKLDAEKREQTLSNILHTASAVVIWITALFVILWQLEVNIAALMTGAGLVAIIVGFAAQNAIKDILAGIFVITENQNRVGDIVTLHAEGTERSGVVEEITIRITSLRDLDGVLHTIRNGSVGVVSNLSFGHANVNIDVSVAYGSDIDKVEKIINEVGEDLAKDEQWTAHIIEPIQFLRVDEFEDSAIRIKSLGMVQPAEQWAVSGEFRRRLIKAFAHSGIEIPFPQMTLHEARGKKG